MIQGRWNQSFIRFIQSDNTSNTKLLQPWNIFGEWNRTQQQKLKNNNDISDLNTTNWKTHFQLNRENHKVHLQ
jgi:hypothetical protein